MALFDPALFDSGIFESGSVHGLGDLTLNTAGRATLAGALEQQITLGDVTLEVAGRTTLTGNLAAQVAGEFALGDLTLAATCLMAVEADVEALGEEANDPLYGTGGPDDPSVPPQARKWLREKYRQPEVPTQGSQQVRQPVHTRPDAGSSPVPATTQIEPALDVSPVIEQARQAAKQAVELAEQARVEREEAARRERNKRVAIALVAALIDD